MPDVSPTVRRPFSLTVSRPSARAAFFAVLAVAVVVTAVKYYAKAEKPSRLGELTRTAFLRWRPQIQALGAGTDIYAAFNYPNPPIMALILYPFTELPPLAGAMAWFAAKVAMAAWIVVWSFRVLGTRYSVLGTPSVQGDRNNEPRPLPDPRPQTPDPVPDWAKAVAVLLAFHPILGDLAHGNVNIFLAFLIFSSLALFCRRRDFASGMVLALAVACKVTPALFVPYLVWKRAWKALLGTLVGLGVWLFAVPGLALGWDYNATLLTSWYERMVKPFVVDGKVTSEHPNQSVPGVVFRLLTAEPSFLDYDDEDGRPVATGFHNVAALSPGQAQLVVKGVMLLFAATIVLLCRWPTHRVAVPRAGPRLAAEFGLILLGMLLFSERTWKHHAVTLVLPFAVLAWAATAPELPRLTRNVVRAAFVLIGGLMVVPSLLPEQEQDLAMVYGHSAAAFALTAIALAVVLREIRPRST
jgi:hypothetical protein